MTDGYAGIQHTPLFKINGQAIPCNVRYGYTEDTEQLVKSQRNSQGVVVSEVVGRRLLKFSNLEWPIMTRSEYEWLQGQIAQFFCKLTYYDARTRRYYY